MGIINFKKKISILSSGTVAGDMERSGALGDIFDVSDGSDRFGAETWEKSESEMQRIALSAAIKKSGVKQEDIDALYAGDLLNQCIGSAFGLSPFGIPYFGIYGACSTLGEGLILCSVMLDSGHANLCAGVCSSHNCSAERQFRFPIEYGGQRPPTAQWTVTGAAAHILAPDRSGKALIRAALVGIAIDGGIADANNMGAAMAPAAADTVLRFFEESRESPSDFDMILTGDLGCEGSSIFCELTKERGLDVSKIHRDCGVLIYDRERQDVHSGGSGCGCSGIVFGSYILPMLEKKELRRILLVPTGALMNPSSVQQGQSILGIAHLLKIECDTNTKEDDKNANRT